MDITGIGAVADAVNSIVSHFFPDKTQEEKDKLALQMQGMLNSQQLTISQIQVDDDEAKSSDPMQHWRGALGWVCVFAFAWQFVLQPFLTYFSVLAMNYYGLKFPPLPVLDSGPLFTLCTGMLGLGAMHVTERIKGAAE